MSDDEEKELRAKLAAAEAMVATMNAKAEELGCEVRIILGELRKADAELKEKFRLILASRNLLLSAGESMLEAFDYDGGRLVGAVFHARNDLRQAVNRVRDMIAKGN